MSFKEVHKLAAIVFTNLVGFTKIMGRDEQEGLDLLQKQRELFFPIVDSSNGTVLKELGDGLLMMFESSIQAVRASLQIQEIAKENEISLRIGIHIGDVVTKDKDIIGSGVNIASRIEQLAPAGSICISEDVWYQIRNQEGLYAVSLGKQKLKNVKRLIEIFKLVPDEITLKAERISFVKNLWQRRVPQIFILYLGACWAVVEFVSSLLVDRYLLSPHLIDFSIVTLLSLIPSILLIAYFHGKPGKDEWTNFEKIGIPLNIILVVFVLFFTFQGKDLGAITETVTIENEDGEQIERIIPKSEFRRSIAIFPFENEQSDSTLFWLQYGFADMLEYDLSQDIFLRFLYKRTLHLKMKDAGFPNGIGLPLMLKKKIASNSHVCHFITGSFEKQNDEYLLKTLLYKAKNAKLISEREYKGPDVFDLIDEVSLQLKHDLKMPTHHIDEVTDLPVSEILTKSIKALKFHTLGRYYFYCDFDFQKAEEYFELSLKEDQTFAYNYADLRGVYLFSNQYQKSEQNHQSLMKYLYKLSERTQFENKAFYYFNKNDLNKQINVAKMWTELYPNDTKAHDQLALAYSFKGDKDKEIEEYKCILELDPERYNHLKDIGFYYEQKGEFEEALKYYKKYADQLPENYSSYTTIGDLYYTMEDYEQAKSYYEKALVFESEKISLLLYLANIEKKLGNFDKAFEQYNDTLAQCKTSNDSVKVYLKLADFKKSLGNFDKAFEQYEDAFKICKTQKDSARVYGWLEDYYETKGQINNSIKYWEMELKLEQKSGPFVFVLSKMWGLYKYVLVGKKDIAFQEMKSIESQLEELVFQPNVYVGYFELYSHLEDADNAERMINKFEKNIQKSGADIWRDWIFTAWGKVHELRDENEEAIISYNRFLELRPTETLNIEMGRCYRKLSEYKKAEEYLIIEIKKHPFDPETNYELALLYNDMGKKEKALEHLNITLDVWQDADPEYIPAQKAREKLKELNKL